MALYDAALARGADPMRIAHNQWMCAILLGHFAAAWSVCDRVLAERRERNLSCPDAPYHERWVWDGTNLDGQRVLVRCYHGLGDAIQFLRFAKPLRRRARHVAVQAVPALLPLAERIEGVDEVVALDQAADPAYEVDIEASELPHALRVSAAMVAPLIPYIAVDRPCAPRCRISEGHPMTIGVAWAAGGWRPERSVPFLQFRRLLTGRGIGFVNLQRGDALADLDGTPEPILAEWGERTTDLVETARLLVRLDLVIAVDTMIAHLAGALGVPVWLLLHWNADWRWMLNGSASPWYPTMRIFRQPVPGAWDEVIDAIAAELSQLRPSTNC